MGETDNTIGCVEGVKTRNNASGYALMDLRECGARCQSTSCLGLGLVERFTEKPSGSARERNMEMEW
jgi:hypothetical protein